MEIKLQKWGNSYGVRIPSTFLKTLNIGKNDKVLIEQKEDKIIISKSKKQKISLTERFKNYKGENESSTFVWDDPIGREIW
ncbi:MAG: AbrB/MazE/SpoVT family DNA-binding domain-containing protein [Bacilli bacterium]|nr:AbrB/MazE/SpoVT family DNA-binding domain-containing protein [Bacilli bacterium]